MNSDNKLSFIPERYIALASEYPNLSICRVVSQQKGQYTIISHAGEQRASVSGRLQHEAKTVSEYPTVGDYVMAELNYPGVAVIRHLLPRKGVFMRKAAGTARRRNRQLPYRQRQLLPGTCARRRSPMTTLS